jgi:hypothetical protein
MSNQNVTSWYDRKIFILFYRVPNNKLNTTSVSQKTSIFEIFYAIKVFFFQKNEPDQSKKKMIFTANQSVIQPFSNISERNKSSNNSMISIYFLLVSFLGFSICFITFLILKAYKLRIRQSLNTQFDWMIAESIENNLLDDSLSSKSLYDVRGELQLATNENKDTLTNSVQIVQQKNMSAIEFILPSYEHLSASRL